MAYIPGFKHDVFISYAHFDNEADTQDIRWVSRFQADLKKALRQRWGWSRRSSSIPRPAGAHEIDRLMTESARHAAVFVPIFSPSYIKREWTMQARSRPSIRPPAASNRIVTVELLPVKESEYPAALPASQAHAVLVEATSAKKTSRSNSRRNRTPTNTTAGCRCSPSDGRADACSCRQPDARRATARSPAVAKRSNRRPQRLRPAGAHGGIQAR